MKNSVRRTTNFVRRNKNALLVAGITIPVIVLQSRGISSLNEFLKENDLFDKYYLADLAEELNNA